MSSAQSRFVSVDYAAQKTCGIRLQPTMGEARLPSSPARPVSGSMDSATGALEVLRARPAAAPPKLPSEPSDILV
jgi:hypothetical protein